MRPTQLYELTLYCCCMTSTLSTIHEGPGASLGFLGSRCLSAGPAPRFSALGLDPWGLGPAKLTGDGRVGVERLRWATAAAPEEATGLGAARGLGAVRGLGPLMGRGLGPPSGEGPVRGLGPGRGLGPPSGDGPARGRDMGVGLVWRMQWEYVCGLAAVMCGNGVC